MSEEQRAALKAYCRIDHDDDDALLDALWRGAVEYLGGESRYMPDNPLYITAIHGIVNEWYSGEGMSSGVAVGLRQIVNQLKLSTEDGAV